MTRYLLNRGVTAACFVLLLGGTAAAQTTRVVQPRAGQPAEVVTGPGAPERGPYASETRDSLKSLLEACPPSLGRILKLDPSLMSNQAYLAPYPRLATFLAQHPEIARDPRYFLESVDVDPDYRRTTPQEEAILMWRNLMEGTAMFLVFATIVGAVVWLVKAIIEYRRWNRLSKVHVEVHNKLLDRFSNNDELLAYVQSPAGLKFLESAPRTLHLEGGDWNVPVRRILWAVQAGLVLAAGGVGVLIVSGDVAAEIQQPLFAIGCVVLSLGVGFVLSAIVSYVLSARMGLLAAAGTTPVAPPRA